MQKRRDFCRYAVAAAASRLAGQPRPDGLVRQIDHVLIGSSNAEALFRLFSQTLGLPVAWPFASYGGFSSGGVTLGNVNLELIRFQARSETGLIGIALEPKSLPDLVPALDGRGIAHGAPNPAFFKDPSGVDRLAWTLVPLTATPPAPAGQLFFCKYNDPKLDEGREQLRRELEKKDGGPLGIVRATEIVVGARDLSAAMRDYRAVFGPSRDGEDAVWDLAPGPALRLNADAKDRYAGLRIEVRDIERARAFLKREALMGRSSAGAVELDPARVEDANVSFSVR